jgi:hypothetical protein
MAIPILMLNTTTCAAPPPASRILFPPIATSRQWLASEMEAAPLAMEEEDLEITVFLTRHSHLNPHVSQRFQRFLPDLGRSLSQESTSSLAQIAPVWSSHADPPHLRPGTFLARFIEARS